MQDDFDVGSGPFRFPAYYDDRHFIGEALTMNPRSISLSHDPEERIAKRAQLGWRALIAGVVGVLVSGICLNLGLPAVTGATQWPQDCTRWEIKRFDKAIKSYRDKYDAYPKLSQVPMYPVGPPKDGWGGRMVYMAQGKNYLLISYGADHKPGGRGLNCDLSNRNLTPLQSQPALLEVLVHPLSRPFEYGVMVCGLLTALMTLSSIAAPDFTGKGWMLLMVKVTITLVAAVFVSLIVLVADIPSRH